MTEFFISHSSKDDAFVRDLRAALADHGQDGWIDSRELRGGDPLWPEIRKAIEEASGYAVLVSPEGLQSKWVGKELRYALAVQRRRSRSKLSQWLYRLSFGLIEIGPRNRRNGGKYPIIPLSLDDTKLGVLETFFDEAPRYIPVGSYPGGIEAALNAILVALGKRKPVDVAPAPQPRAEPLEELVLKLGDLRFHESDGKRRASARARLVYEPATPGRENVFSTQP